MQEIEKLGQHHNQSLRGGMITNIARPAPPIWGGLFAFRARMEQIEPDPNHRRQLDWIIGKLRREITQK